MAFEFVAATPEAEQLQTIEDNKEDLTETEVDILRAAFNLDVTEEDFHKYLEEFAGRLLHSTNPFGVNVDPLGLTWDQIPWNIYLKGANLAKDRTNFLSVGYGDKEFFTKPQRNSGLGIPLVVGWMTDGTIKVIGKPGKRSLDPTQWTLRAPEAKLEEDRERYLTELPHHPFHLLLYGSGTNRADKNAKDGVQKGNLVYLSWDATLTEAKKQVSALIWTIANDLVIPAGHEQEDGSWKAPTVAEAKAFARKKYGPVFDPLVVSDATDKKDVMPETAVTSLFGGGTKGEEETTPEEAAPEKPTPEKEAKASKDPEAPKNSVDAKPTEAPSKDSAETEKKPKKGIPTAIVVLGWCLGLLIVGGLAWMLTSGLRKKPTRS